MGGLFLEPKDFFCGHLHVGTSEEADADADVDGVFLGQLDNLGGLAKGVEAEDAYMLAEGETGALERDLEVILRHHGLEELHLGLGDDGIGYASVPGACRVAHEGVDAVLLAQHLEVRLQGLDEHDAGDEYHLHHAFLIASPGMYLVMDRSVGYYVVFQQFIPYLFLCTWSHPSHKPTTFGYAYGAVSGYHWRRRRWFNSGLETHLNTLG